MQRGAGVAVVLFALWACSNGGSGRTSSSVDDPPQGDASPAGRTWNPRHALDCDAWCAKAARKCPAVFGPDAGGAACPTQCQQEIAAAAGCAVAIASYLSCTMDDAAYRCDLPALQQTACQGELAAFHDCVVANADAGPPDASAAAIPRAPR